jgi:hypothetical protein
MDNNIISGLTTENELKKLGKKLYQKEEKEEKNILYWKKLDKLMKTVKPLDKESFLIKYSISNMNEIKLMLFDSFEINSLAFKKIEYQAFILDKANSTNSEYEILRTDNDIVINDYIKEIEELEQINKKLESNISIKENRILNLRNKCIVKNKKNKYKNLYLFFNLVIYILLFVYYILYINNDNEIYKLIKNLYKYIEL